MNYRNLRGLIAAGTLVIAGVVSVAADEITTLSGKRFTDAQALRLEGDGIQIKHSGGTDHVAWSDLPPALREKYKSDPRLIELARKEAEIDKLKSDLAKAQDEISHLKSDLAKPRPEAKGKIVVEEKPIKPLPELPPLKPEDVIESHDLVRYFQTDANGAGQRFQKQSLRVRGVVTRFEPKMFRRTYSVSLESPEGTTLVCDFFYADDYRTVYAKERGQKLVAAVPGRGELPLLEIGQTVVIRGRCDGSRKPEVVLSGCEIAR